MTTILKCLPLSTSLLTVSPGRNFTNWSISYFCSLFACPVYILLGIVRWCSLIASTRKKILKPSNTAMSIATGRYPFC